MCHQYVAVECLPNKIWHFLSRHVQAVQATNADCQETRVGIRCIWCMRRCSHKTCIVIGSHTHATHPGSSLTSHVSYE
jgi:hypothetical protein